MPLSHKHMTNAALIIFYERGCAGGSAWLEGRGERWAAGGLLCTEERAVVKSPLEHHSASDPLISTPQLHQHPNEHGVASETDFKHAHVHILIHVHCIGLEPCAPLNSKWCTVSSREPGDERRPCSSSDPSINDGLLKLILCILV